LLGDGNDARVSRDADNFKVGQKANTLAYYQACRALAIEGLTGDTNQFSWHGRRWDNGQLNTTRYNHVMTPNGLTCGRNAGANGGGAITASSRHPGGVNVLLGDGSITFISDSIDTQAWWALGTRAGGETVQF
jgi:prepilin-type processing-associated H-X9-DG protein